MKVERVINKDGTVYWLASGIRINTWVLAEGKTRREAMYNWYDHILGGKNVPQRNEQG